MQKAKQQMLRKMAQGAPRWKQFSTSAPIVPRALYSTYTTIESINVARQAAVWRLPSWVMGRTPTALALRAHSAPLPRFAPRIRKRPSGLWTQSRPALVGAAMLLRHLGGVAFQHFNAFMLKYPIFAPAILGTIRYGFVDYCVQKAAEDKICWTRVAAFTCFGIINCAFFGSLYVKVYPMLQSRFQWFSPSVMTAWDLLVMSPACYFTLFYSVQFVFCDPKGIRRFDSQAVYTKWRGNIKEDVRNLLAFWVPVHMINFTLLPFHFRSLFALSTGIVWSSIMSLCRGHYD